MLNDAKYNTITNCDISVDSISNGRGFAGILLAGMSASPYNLSATTSGKYATITNNLISGGYYGIAISSSATARDTGIVIENNTINFQQMKRNCMKQFSFPKTSRYSIVRVRAFSKLFSLSAELISPLRQPLKAMRPSECFERSSLSTRGL